MTLHRLWLLVLSAFVALAPISASAGPRAGALPAAASPAVAHHDGDRGPYSTAGCEAHRTGEADHGANTVDDPSVADRAPAPGQAQPCHSDCPAGFHVCCGGFAMTLPSRAMSVSPPLGSVAIPFFGPSRLASRAEGIFRPPRPRS